MWSVLSDPSWCIVAIRVSGLESMRETTSCQNRSVAAMYVVTASNRVSASAVVNLSDSRRESSVVLQCDSDNVLIMIRRCAVYRLHTNR